MFTKEELLQKGISEEVANEIIAASENDEDSLQALEKALEGPESQDLFKAGSGGDDDEDAKEDEEEKEDYNEEYMKKYMKRYMKENKKSCGKMAKEVGIFGGNMEKAISDFDADAEGAIVEMTDLTPILEGQMEFNAAMAKAIGEISEQIAYVSAKSEDSFDLMQKAARAQVDQAKNLNGFLGQPQGRKGTLSSTEPLKKGTDVPLISANANEEIYKVLIKAVKNDDRNAGMIISAFESHGKDANKLNSAQRQYINELITKEAQ